MFKIPDSILETLRCSLCDGYTNSSPAVVKNGLQICAKCYKILPVEERQLCVKQVTFEAVAQCLVFPCRYHKMGCSHTFAFGEENGHESECKKRYFTFPDVVTNNGNCETLETEAVAISLENVSAAYSYSTPKSESVGYGRLYENIYSTIDSLPPKKNVQCINCSAEVQKNNSNTCLFNHVSCDTCKQDMCVACVKNLDGTSKIACKNAARGCPELLLQNDFGLHRDNCVFNEIHCPFEKCDTKDVMQKLMEHLVEKHEKDVVISNETTKSVGHKDQEVILLCYDGIFKCNYFYFKQQVDILVVYLGPCSKASEYQFEVSVNVNKKVLTKRLHCANWNDCMLASSVVFDKSELTSASDKKFSFKMNIKIVGQRSGSL